MTATNNENASQQSPMHFGRRAWLQGTVLTLLAVPRTLATADETLPVLKVGLVTDMHFADKPAAGTRFYRETLDKLSEAATKFRESSIELLVELGDFIDAAESVDVELKYLRRIQKEFAELCPDRHYVLGNHCVDTLQKEEFLSEVGQEKSYYSFDRQGTHFIVLDACFRTDGTPYGRKNFQWTDANIPPTELEWLQADLAATSLPTIVLAHQRLDPSGSHEVRNSKSVRELLEKSGKVRLVMQGHSHKNDLQDINGIHYCTLVAMVEGSGAENNGYSTLEIMSDQSFRITGFRQQKSYTWGR